MSANAKVELSAEPVERTAESNLIKTFDSHVVPCRAAVELNDPYSSFCLKARPRDKITKTYLTFVQHWVLYMLYMLKEILSQIFVFVELRFVAMVTDLPWQQRSIYIFYFDYCAHIAGLNLIVTFIVLNYLRLRLENAAIIPQNLVFKQ